jgi:hypothetical protein
MPRRAEDDCHDASASEVEATVCERREYAARRRDSVRVPSVDTSDAVALIAHGGVERERPRTRRAEQAAGTRSCTKTAVSFANV